MRAEWNGRASPPSAKMVLTENHPAWIGRAGTVL